MRRGPHRLPLASLARGFFVSGERNGRRQVRPEDDRGEVAARLGGRAGVLRRQSGARDAARRHALVPARDAAVPVRQRHPHGPRPQLHDGRRPDARPPPQRLEGRAPDGLGRLRPAGRERGHPRGRPSARDHGAQHRHHPRADEAARLGDRLGPRGLVARPALLPLDAVAVPEVLRGRARVPEGSAGQLVPERPDGDRQRVHRRRPLRALRRARRAAEHDAVVLQDDRVRRRAARVRPAARRRVAGADEDDPAQLDRPLRGRADPLPRRRPRPGLSRSSRPARTRCSARPSSSSRPSTRSSRRTRARRRRRMRVTRARAARRTVPPRRRRPASSPVITRRTRSTASGSRSGSPTTS